jgi:hypothetical protein
MKLEIDNWGTGYLDFTIEDIQHDIIVKNCNKIILYRR